MDSSRYQCRKSIEENQRARLQALVSALLPKNPFHTRKLRDAGIEDNTLGLEDFKDLVPFTSKQELIEDQRSHPPYGSNLTYPMERYCRLSQSSATGGTPLRWLDTRESWNWMLGCWRQVFDAMDITSRDRVFFASSFAPFLGFWTAFEAASQLGCLCIPGGGLGSSARLASQEEIEVSPEEITEEIKKAAESMGQPVEKVQQYFSEPDQLAGLQADLRRSKALAIIVDGAKIN